MTPPPHGSRDPEPAPREPSPDPSPGDEAPPAVHPGGDPPSAVHPGGDPSRALRSPGEATSARAPGDATSTAAAGGAEPSPELPPGYRFRARLAERPGVRVVRAVRAAEGRDVVLRLEAGAGAEARAELAVLAALDHPGVAPLLDHGALPGGGRYLARAWVPGEDLAAWARGRAPEELGRAVAELCDALDALHRSGFAHGDLKAANVLVDAAGRPVLVDFGLARAARADAPAAAPAMADDAPSGVAGTLFALAPELLLGAPPSPRTDLFALGALLHELLVGRRASARDFYARFPARSFLDAAGSSPEDLPHWARDLVASLVQRDPARRPASAADVGRTLRARLGLPPAPAPVAATLRLPPALGRERELASLFDELQAAAEARTDEPRPVWVRLAAGESAPLLAEALRVHAALRGAATRGVDLARELPRLRGAGALDAFALELAAAAEPLLVVAAPAEADGWGERALLALVRAARQRGRRAPLLVVLAPRAPRALSGDAGDGARWTEHALPPLGAEDLERFLAPRLPGEEPARVAALAALVHAASAGTVEGAARALERAVRDGLLLPAEGGAALRPGPLPSALDAGAAALPSDLAPAERRVLAALAVAGGRATPDELAPLLAAPHGEAAPVEDAVLGRALRTLSERGLVRLEPRPEGLEVVSTRPTSARECLGGDERALRALHERRADDLERRGAERWRALAHRFRATPDAASAGRVREEVDARVERGAPEIALALCERVEAFARELGLDLAREAPRLVAARAAAWAGLGRLEEAERALAALDAAAPEAGDEARALAHLLRGRIAARKGDADAALAHLERALALDPGLEEEVAASRAHLLHLAGRHAEVVELARARGLWPLPALAAGEGAPSRRAAFLASLAALSAFRLGDVEAARDATERLAAAAEAEGDAAREAALRLDLATIARRTGDLAAPERELERAADLYARAGHLAGVAHARAALGGLLRERGELVRAEPLIVSALEIRERLGDEAGAVTQRGMLGLLHAERGHARAAIEELERAAARMKGSQRLRFAPLLRARADEMRARLGERPEDAAARDEEAADPRVLLARARAALLRGLERGARGLAERAAELAASLGLAPVEGEARLVLAVLDGAPPPRATPGSAADEDARVIELLLRDEGFDAAAALSLARDLARRGRDDRSARTALAAATRAPRDPSGAALARAAAELAAETFARCAEGLSAEESEALRARLLTLPDPRPGDLAPRPPDVDDEELEMETLLDINRRLVEQQDLPSLLGEIVESALRLTGAERGFLVLEQGGELRFDTALDSRRGDLSQPDLEVSRSVIGEALGRMRPVCVSNAVDDPLLGHNPSIASLELRSILCTPFRVDEDLRGAIYLDHRLRRGAFDERAGRLGRLLADQAALAIRQMRRLDEIRELNRRLESRVTSSESELRAARERLERAGLVEPVGGLIGESEAMRRVRELLARAARTDLPVLVTGESGTGKELAARALHDLSPRSAGPFVGENVAALPPSLVESELFGFVRGAFTGADSDRPGLFERAHGGTLFLDEIGEMPLELQAKLLRALETGEVRRIGDAAPREVDVRLVVATNRDLERAVADKAFRQDLYYRLNALRVEMPPLAARTEDVPALVEHFLALEAARTGVRRRVAKAVLQRLERRPWPGNVRELRNEVARLCVVSEGDLDDPALVRAPDPALAARPDPGGRPRTLAELERAAIEQALLHTGGDKRRAAELLGISRAKIYQRLKEWAEAEGSPPAGADDAEDDPDLA